ncbi:MAG: hypothetical protein ACPGZS_05150, partial [Candidatus Puniceispirillaceae bacterium]
MPLILWFVRGLHDPKKLGKNHWWKNSGKDTVSRYRFEAPNGHVNKNFTRDFWRGFHVVTDAGYLLCADS